MSISNNGLGRPERLTDSSGHRTAATSVAALRSVQPVVSERKKAIIALLERTVSVGMTRYELAVEMDIPVQLICGRAHELVKAGMVVEMGDTRPAPSGRASKIMRLHKYTGDPECELQAGTVHVSDILPKVVQ